jgi:hypothetical protein
MMDSCAAFIDADGIDVVATSEYQLHAARAAFVRRDCEHCRGERGDRAALLRGDQQRQCGAVVDAYAEDGCLGPGDAGLGVFPSSRYDGRRAIFLRSQGLRFTIHSMTAEVTVSRSGGITQ